MSYKKTYDEYTKTFPRVMLELRANPPKVEDDE